MPLAGRPYVLPFWSTAKRPLELCQLLNELLTWSWGSFRPIWMSFSLVICRSQSFLLSCNHYEFKKHGPANRLLVSLYGRTVSVGDTNASCSIQFTFRSIECRQSKGKHRKMIPFQGCYLAKIRNWWNRIECMQARRLSQILAFSSFDSWDRPEYVLLSFQYNPYDFSNDGQTDGLIGQISTGKSLKKFENFTHFAKWLSCHEPAPTPVACPGVFKVYPHPPLFVVNLLRVKPESVNCDCLQINYGATR